ncbi:MAG TPA: serine/threonine-protein kinase [Kofleriaceae bacterium]
MVELPTHLRMTRWSSLFVLVAVVALFTLGEGVRILVRMRTVVVPGVYYNLDRQVTGFADAGAQGHDIHLLDHIRTFDGQPLADAYDLARRSQAVAAGTAVELGISTRRDGPIHDVRMIATHPNWATAWLRFITGAAFVLIGLAVFWFHPGNRAAWPFMLACVAYGITVLIASSVVRALETSLHSRLGLFAFGAFAPLFLHLFAVFPRPMRAVVRRPWLVPAIDLYALALGAAAAAVQGWPPGVIVVFQLIYATIAISVGLMIAIVLWRLRRPAPREDVTRLRALLLAIVLAFPIPALFGMLATFGVIKPRSGALEWVMKLLLLTFPAIVGHAILRRDLFQIDRAVARAAAASLIVGTAALAAIGIAIALPELAAPAAVVASPAAMVIVIVGATAALWPIQRRIQRALIDRFGSPDADDRLASVREALGELAEAAEPALFGRVERRLEEAIGIDDAALLIAEGTGLRRPATGERVGRDAFSRVVELQLRDDRVGVLGLGRARTAVGPKQQQLALQLAPEIARVLHGRGSADKLGDYRIDRFLAAGGMGNVYVGAKIGAGGFVKEVAIKQLLPELAVEPAVVDRFLKEARLVARLSHPGIVQTLELGEHERGFYIVMEYVRGVDAATLMRRLKRKRARIPLAIAAHATIQICLALDHVHRARDEAGTPLGLIHHDVSPHNVLIDHDGNIKLADFGVAHMRADPSQTGLLVGKVGYVSPEQIAGDPYDHRIDVFAAGIVLYELVTFQHPFLRGSEDATLRATEHGRYLPPETLREDCPDALADGIARSLAPADRRYATAAELAEALQRVYPLDSRNAAALGKLVDTVASIDPKASASMPAATMTLPTARG